jgi:hypothetical protein
MTFIYINLAIWLDPSHGPSGLDAPLKGADLAVSIAALALARHRRHGSSDLHLPRTDPKISPGLYTKTSLKCEYNSLPNMAFIKDVSV